MQVLIVSVVLPVTYLSIVFVNITITEVCIVLSMAQSLSKIYLHLIFHVKSDSPKIKEADIARVCAYIGQLIKVAGCDNIIVGGMPDHIHALFVLSRNVAVAQVVEEIKRNSSRWLKGVDDDYRFFAWQRGYGVFSVSQSGIDGAIRYIAHQHEHHHKLSFADEYRRLLDLYKVDYDEKFLLSD